MHPSLPSLYCPFPAAINPHANIVHERAVAWARRFHLLRREAAYRRLNRLQYSMLMARAYPSASLEGLQLVADWSTWLFLLDDQCDEAGIGKEPEQLASMHALLLDVLDGTPPSAHADAFAHALWDVYTRLHKYAHAEWLQRFRESVRMYFEANVWEARNRQSGQPPDVVTYCAMRPFTSAVYPCLMLIELTDHLRLPSAVLHNPHVQRLELMTNNVISWANDLVSFEKEQQQGDVHNLVLVLAHERGISLQAAVERAVVLHDAEVRAFVALAKQLPAIMPTSTADLERYVTGMRFWMRANLDWSLAAARYTSVQPVVAETLVQHF